MTTFKDPVATKNLEELASNAESVARTLALAGRHSEAVARILAAEKECRNAADGASASRLCVWLLNEYFNADDVDRASEWLHTACKKRAQLKRVQVDLVHSAMVWLETITDREALYKLLETLCTVTEGKMYLEVERARVILKLARLKEEEGDIETASAVLQEVQVETNIHMDKLEKGEYILEQMRLVLKKEDYTRCQIVAKKINRSTIEGEGFELIKLIYYSYLAIYYNHEGDMSDLAKCYHTCLKTDFNAPSIDYNKLAAFIPPETTNLQKWYLDCLSIAHALSDETPIKVLSIKGILKENEKLYKSSPDMQEMLEKMTIEDVTPFTPGGQVEQHPLLASDMILPNSEMRRQRLRIAYLHHNLVVVSHFYRRTTLSLLSTLLNFPVDDVEEELCTLIGERQLVAKINRPTGIVCFNSSRPEDALCDWQRSITRTLDGLCEACNLIEKERHIHESKATVTQ